MCSFLLTFSAMFTGDSLSYETSQMTSFERPAHTTLGLVSKLLWVLQPNPWSNRSEVVIETVQKAFLCCCWPELVTSIISVISGKSGYSESQCSCSNNPSVKAQLQQQQQIPWLRIALVAFKGKYTRKRHWGGERKTLAWRKKGSTMALTSCGTVSPS